MSNYNIYSDKVLLEFLRNGDEKAFKILYDKYWNQIFCIAKAKLKNHAIAEEIVQDIFTDLWARRKELHVQSELTAYLSVCVKYKVINVQAKQQRALIYQKYKSATHPSASSSTEDWLSFEELKAELAKGLAALSEKGRTAFKLSKEEGLSYKEIALQLNTTEKAVERSIARVVKSLSVSLRQFLSIF
ncbi:RNA polymerase sigma factor [Arachidicoccus sp.]|uniref:RNA polymerase sigma factor n=1 Tax=Arachidicoccus sp. TaxID=1872624 RepID=UPI003D1B5E61